MYPEVGGMGQVPNLAGGGGGVGKKRTGSELNFKNCLGIPQLNISIEQEVLQNATGGKTHVKLTVRASNYRISLINALINSINAMLVTICIIK